jgi:hypothetical protein
MKMPVDIQLDSSEASPNVLRFKTADGAVSGTAYRASGLCETHYDILTAKKLVQGQARTPIRPRMVQRSEEVGEFNVVGQVVFLWNNGMSVVEAYGFNFWIPPDEINEPVIRGDWVELHIRKLTLYV